MLKMVLSGSTPRISGHVVTLVRFHFLVFSSVLIREKKGKSSRGTSTNGGNSFKFRAHKAITHGTMDIWDLDLHRKVRDQVAFHGYFLDTQK